MKVAVYDINGKKKSELALPAQFEEPLRADLIKRAVLAQQSHSYQPYGSDPLAGTKQGDATPKRRRKYKTTYGHGVSRIKRKYSWHRGLQFGYIGAFVASARGGRAAFPPKTEKAFKESINSKERTKAIRSAIAATSVKEIVAKRNHQVSAVAALPIIVEDKMETISKTKDVRSLLEKLGLKDELMRTSEKKIRPGRGTMRGRRYRSKVGPLFIVSKNCGLVKAAKNILGADIVTVRDLNAEALAPGTQPGRLTVWSQSAVEALGKEGLFS